MNDEKTIEQNKPEVIPSNSPELTGEEKQKIAEEWLIPHAGRPPKSIAPIVRELSGKGIEKKEIAIRVSKREKEAIERKKRHSELAKARTLQKNIAKVQKTEEFLQAFIESNGNLTEAGLKVFNTTDKSYAAAKANDYWKSNQVFLRRFLEKKGYTLGWMVDLLAKKAVEGRSADFIDRLFRIAGYGELQPPKYAPPTIINVGQVQKKLASEYGFGEGEIVDGETEDAS